MEQRSSCIHYEWNSLNKEISLLDDFIKNKEHTFRFDIETNDKSEKREKLKSDKEEFERIAKEAGFLDKFSYTTNPICLKTIKFDKPFFEMTETEQYAVLEKEYKMLEDFTDYIAGKFFSK